jgi:hypothetical protein
MIGASQQEAPGARTQLKLSDLVLPVPPQIRHLAKETIRFYAFQEEAPNVGSWPTSAYLRVAQSGRLAGVDWSRYSIVARAVIELTNPALMLGSTSTGVDFLY